MAAPKAKPEAPPQGTRDLTGMSIGRFVILARLGGGGMGEVYRAEDTRLKRSVALKRMAPRLRCNAHYRQRFLHEAECASRLNEPHIASIYDVFEDGDETFLVMEYVEGQTLRQRLTRRLDMREFLEIAVQCAAALAAAHEQRIIHGDIKPENVMLTLAGQVKILDFGVAKFLPQLDETLPTDQLSTQTGFLGGTPAYMAPEVLLEKGANGRADLFSLGVIFYEALSGVHPFWSDKSLVTWSRILEEVPPPLRQRNPQIPAELDRVVEKLLAKDADDRYAAAGELLVDLRALQRSKREAPPTTAVPLPWWNAKRLGITAGIALVMFAFLLSAYPGVRQSFKTWLGIYTVPREKIVAVLPFTVISGDAQSAAFSDGLTETLTAKLTQLTADPALQVVPAPDVRRKDVITAEGARKEFGATMVLEGSLFRSEDQVRINYALVDTRSHLQVRAGSLTVAASDPFAVQDQVVSAAVNMLELEVQPGERAALKTHGTQVPSAYDLYLQGRGYLQNYDKAENIENAIKVFDTALAMDPGYALAYAGKGEADWKMYESSKDPQWVRSSRRDCERALSLNGELPAAHVCLGRLYKGTGHYQQAAAEFERVVRAEPSNDDAYRELAETYARVGKPADAEATYRRAIALRPHYWAAYNWLGAFYYGQARFPEASEMFRQVVALAPDNVRGYYNLGASYVEEARYSDAIAASQRSIAIQPSDYGYTNLGNAYFFLRRFEDADRAYEEAVKLMPRDALSWWNLGDGYYWTPGKRTQSAAAYKRCLELAKDDLRINPKDAKTYGVAAICSAMSGEEKAALDSLKQALQIAPSDPTLAFQAALIYNQFNHTDETLAWLRKARAGDYSEARIRDYPNFDALRNDPRFQELFRPKSLHK